MQVQSPKPVMEERGTSKLWRSRSLPANSREVTRSPAMTRAGSIKTTRQGCERSGLFCAGKATRPASALLERRKKVNPALKVEAFDSNDPSPAAPAPASKPRSPYEILQVSPLASQEAIKTAYWRSALKHHPDKVPSQLRDASTLLFLEIQSAYSTLKDPISRALFDRHLPFPSPGYHHPSSTPPSPSTTYPYTPRAHSTTYPYTPRPHPSPSSTQNFSPYPYSTPTPSSPYPYSPSRPASSPNYFTPRSPYSVGRNWETDQCF